MQPTNDKRGVTSMFDNIAHSYDFLNHLLTGGIDRYWRKQLVKRAANQPTRSIVDVATGTGDLAIALHRAIRPEQLIGLDLSENMLAVAQKKIERHQLQHSIILQKGNGEETGLGSFSCDLITVGFGIRNFQHPEKGLAEFHRLLTRGGRLLILEFSIPTNRLFRSVYLFYFKHLLPLIGKWLSGHASAYSYLPASVLSFPCGETFADMMREAGFQNVSFSSYTFGIVTLYEGVKA